MLRDHLLARVTETGPIPFEDFMEVALYDPEGGFFSGAEVRSTKEGDFLTSPEVSPMFGETLARFVSAERELLDDPSGFAVVEVGAGSGSLLAPLLEVLQPPPPAWGVEASPAARAALGELLGEDRALASLGELPGRQRGVVITNELVDNLPMALAVRAGGGWEERWVGVEDGELALMPHPARADVARWCDDYAGTVPEGGMVEVQLAAGRWIDTALSVLDSGVVVIVDYGGTAAELEPRRTQGTLRTYRAHHLGPDPLSEPGATDITADVNFTALAAAAEAAGAIVELHRQDDFLAEWGLRDRLSELRAAELELARGDDAIARLQVRSQVTDAETLLHPRGLGDFRVMVARIHPRRD